MSALLRFIGVMNAAIWVGGAIFFTFFAAPVLFTPESKKIAGEAQVGILAMKMLDRYFLLNYLCGSIALIHQLAEWVYQGRPLRRMTLSLLLIVFGLAVLGGLALKPRMVELHQKIYAYQKTPEGYFRTPVAPEEERREAHRQFKIWHAASMSLNVVAIGALLAFAWRTLNPGNGLRFVPTNRFRS